MRHEVFSGSVFSVQGRIGGAGCRQRGSELKTENRTLKASRAFTLIELLVVITIIAILASLILNTAGGVQKEAARARAKSEIKALETALESYKSDNGDYPIGSNGSPLSASAPANGNAVLFTNLCPATGKVYFEFKKGMTNASGGTTNIIDPFGEQYGYSYPGNPTCSGTNFFDLWSRAGSGNTNAWIKNW